MVAGMLAVAIGQAAMVVGQDEPRQRHGASAAYRPSVESVTEPIRLMECRLADGNRRWSRLSLRFTGSRGYLTADGRVRATRRTVDVLADPAGLLEGLPLWDVNDGTILFGSEQGRSVVLWSAAPPPAYATVALVPRGPGMTRASGDPAYAGFCDVTETPQQPLTAEEAAREQRQ